MIAVQVRRYSAGAADPYGNNPGAWASPVAWAVWWIAPGAMQENADGRDASIVAFSIGAPKSPAVPTERDRVLVDGQEYEVEGLPQDWTRGPWPNAAAGVVVELRRISG